MTTTKITMALAELAEKGSDVDLLREMFQFVAQRLMDMDVETLCGANRRRVAASKEAFAPLGTPQRRKEVKIHGVSVRATRKPRLPRRLPVVSL